MGIIKRKNIYYFRIMINGCEIRRSLHTENRSTAKKLWDTWYCSYFENKINGSNEIPLIDLHHTDKKDYQIVEIKKPAIETAFREHIRIGKAEFITEDSLQMKQRLLRMLIKAKITWEDNLQNRIFEFQEDLRQKFAASTSDKFITFLKAFFKYCVKRGYLDVNTYTQITFLKRKKLVLIELYFLMKILKICGVIVLEKGILIF